MPLRSGAGAFGSGKAPAVRPPPHRRAERGATSVEFAILALPFILMLGAIFETGLMLFAQSQLRNATALTARHLRVGQLQPDATVDQIAVDICQNVTLLHDCVGSLRVNVQANTSFTGLAAMVQDVSALGVNHGAGNITGMSVALTVTYDWAFRLPLGDLLGNTDTTPRARRLSAISVFRPEP